MSSATSVENVTTAEDCPLAAVLPASDCVALLNVFRKRVRALRNAFLKRFSNPICWRCRLVRLTDTVIVITATTTKITTQAIRQGELLSQQSLLLLLLGWSLTHPVFGLAGGGGSCTVGAGC